MFCDNFGRVLSRLAWIAQFRHSIPSILIKYVSFLLTPKAFKGVFLKGFSITVWLRLQNFSVAHTQLLPNFPIFTFILGDVLQLYFFAHAVHTRPTTLHNVQPCPSPLLPFSLLLDLRGSAWAFSDLRWLWASQVSCAIRILPSFLCFFWEGAYGTFLTANALPSSKANIRFLSSWLSLKSFPELVSVKSRILCILLVCLMYSLLFSIIPLVPW